VAGASWRVWYFAVQWFFAYNAYYGGAPVQLPNPVDPEL
jgi:hypothetical protein